MLAPTSLLDQAGTNGRTVLLLDLDGGAAARQSELGRKLSAAGFRLLTFDLRATGGTRVEPDQVGAASDHNSAEWSLWLGPTLLEQWVGEVRRSITQGGAERVTVIGTDQAGRLALAAAAVDDRIAQVVTLDSLASLISEQPCRGQRLGSLVPGILREVGDLAHLAALIAPRPLLIAGGVDGGGAPLSADELAQHYQFTRTAYRLESGTCDVTGSQSVDELVARLLAQ